MLESPACVYQEDILLEIWKPIPGFEGYYEASNLGRIRGVDRVVERQRHAPLNIKGKILTQFSKPGKGTKDRFQVNMCKNGKAYSKLVSRLVASAFLPNPNNYEQVNHKDENPANNNVDNLEWCTNEYNHNYGTRNQRQAEKLMKPVNMYTLNHDFIKQYNNIKSAAEDIDGDPSAITKVCKGKNKTHKNYLFEYVN